MIYTVGHGARSVHDLLKILAASGIQVLVDVRTAPGSRKHPQFGREQLSAAVEGAGIQYQWRKDLGGWRKPVDGSPHTALRSASFRGYADHMDTPLFETALAWLTDRARSQTTAFMCAESLWWRCHRRIIADALLARDWQVVHLLDLERSEPHRLHPNARLVGARVIYDVEEPHQQELIVEGSPSGPPP